MAYQNGPLKREDMMDYEDAMALETHEKIMNKNQLTRAAIDDTYGEKSPTKKRRKLPGKRKWKNKDKTYSALKGSMIAKEFNAEKRAQKAMRNYTKKRRKHDPVQ